MRSVLLAVISTLLGWAQPTASRSPEQLSLSSHHLSAPLRAEVHLPSDYHEFPLRHYPLCLLLHGGGGNAGDLRGLGLTNLAARYQVIIVAPDAGQALFVDPVDSMGDRLESAILQDLLPDLAKRFRVLDGSRGRMLVGLSLGGYAALHMGIRYSGTFAIIASLSGVVEAPRWSATDEAYLPRIMQAQVQRAFGPAGSTARLRKDLFLLVRALTPPARRSLPFLVLDCGTEDMFLPSNQRFAALLARLEISHEFRSPPGSHDGKFWCRQLEDVLRSGVLFLHTGSKGDGPASMPQVHP